MSRRWFILADDLTGAAECAAGFAECGHIAEVRRHAGGSGGVAEVISYDADTRELDAAAAVMRQREVLDRELASGMRLFKKIDSTLRGQPAAEVAAAMAHVQRHSGRAFAVVAPAYPKLRRATLHGRVYLDDRPLEESELWRRDHTYTNADLTAMLFEAGVPSQSLSLDAVRTGTERLKTELASLASSGFGAAVCDAVSDDDLDRIAEASEALDASTLCVGSAGLAHAFARRRAVRSNDAVPLASTSAGTLMVVGSLARESRVASSALAGAQGVTYIGVEREQLVEDPKHTTLEAERSLRAGNDVLLELLMREKPNRTDAIALLQGLGRLLRPLRPHVGAIFATGGQTAAAVLECFDVRSLRILREMEPGVVLGITCGEACVPMVTKAGAFGDATTLVRIAHALRRIKRKGTIE